MALSLKEHGSMFLSYSHWGIGGATHVFGMFYWFDNDTNIKIFIPDEPYFSTIKMIVLSGKGLYESYQLAGQIINPNGDRPLEKAYPNNTLAMPIKFFIFDVTDLINGQPVSRPYADGVWIHEQASKILEMYWLGTLSKTGRLELEPGTILPTQEEQVCIRNSIKYSNLSITEAFKQCNCSEILPPVAYLAGIENLIKTTNDTLFYIYELVITLSKKPKPDGNGTKPDGTPCPEGKTWNPVSLACEAKKNYTLYIALAIAAIFLLKGD